jgi:hypothetical protein
MSIIGASKVVVLWLTRMLPFSESPDRLPGRNIFFVKHVKRQ